MPVPWDLQPRPSCPTSLKAQAVYPQPLWKRPPLPVALRELLQTCTLDNRLPATAAALLSMHGHRDAVFGGVTWGCVMLSAAGTGVMCVCVEVGGCSVPFSLSRPPPGLAAQPCSSLHRPLQCLPPCPGSRASMVPGWESHVEQ